ncbi:hypothetical protein B0H14DRAFT_2581764 [Mycena olivaceomarginata]|nr:hypothetical protein B0H14DRAFT_2581764 [Mycena olivaceomarginata]
MTCPIVPGDVPNTLSKSLNAGASRMGAGRKTIEKFGGLMKTLRQIGVGKRGVEDGGGDEKKAQVGKMIQSVPFIEPIGAILFEFVNVYKSIITTRKRDALLSKSAGLARDIGEALVRMKDNWHANQVSRLERDLGEYMKLLAARKIILTFDDRGLSLRVLQRGELGAEMERLDEKLIAFGTRFRTNRLVDIQIQQGGVAEAVEKIRVTELASKLERWLNAPDPKEDLTRSCELRHKSTCQWVFQTEAFIRWQDYPGELLWIEGPSGSGKTILSSAMIQWLFDDQVILKSNNNAIAYFYFHFADDCKKSMTAALRRLVLQMSAHCPIPYGILEAQYQLSRGQMVPTYEQLLSLFEKILKELGRTYLVLDALDEYSRCRKKSIYVDIKSYVSDEMASNSGLEHWKSDHKVITSHIGKKSAGIIFAPSTTPDLRPGGISVGGPKLLQWLAFSARPLSVAELEDTISFDFSNHEQYIFDPCKRLKPNTLERWLPGLLSVMPSRRKIGEVGRTDGPIRGNYTERSTFSYGPDLPFIHAPLCRPSADPCHAPTTTRSSNTLQNSASSTWFNASPLLAPQCLGLSLTLLEEGSPQYLAFRDEWSDRIAFWSRFRSRFWVAPNEPSPLYICASVGYIEGTAHLATSGSRYSTADFDEALMAAADRNHEQIVDFLIKTGANVNRRGDVSPLQINNKNCYHIAPKSWEKFCKFGEF